MNPFKVFLAGSMITAGGIVAGIKAETVPGTADKGKDETAQTAVKKSHERMEPKVIAFAEPPTSAAESSNIDSLLAAESSKPNYSLKVKGPSTEKVLGDQDAQKSGIIYQTKAGKEKQVNREFAQKKKEHQQKKTTEISFVE